jgi:hypothetical protein
LKDYFYCILIASVLSAICSSLASGGLEKYVKYVCSLICVVAVILPVVRFFNGGIDTKPDFSAEISEYSAQDYISEEAKKRVAEHIKQIVYDKFGITVNDVSIEIYSKDNEVVVGKITLTLDEGDGKYQNEVKEFLLDTLGSAAEVVIFHK